MSLPTIDFQGQSVSFREGWSLLLHGVKCCHSTAGPTGSPMHRSTRCMGFRSRRPVKRSHPWGKTHEIRVAKDVWIFVDDVKIYPEPVSLSSILGLQLQPWKKRRPLKLQSKQGVNWVGSRYVSLLKPPDFELPQEVVYFFSMPSNEITTKWSKLKFHVDQDSGDNNTHVWYIYHIFTNIYHKNHPNVGKYTIHGSSSVWTNYKILISKKEINPFEPWPQVW